MAGLPRSIIKKYGVSKKAWSVFRSSRSRSTKRAPRKTQVNSMARRRRFSRARAYASSFRRGYRRRSNSFGGKTGGMVDAALGGAIAGAALKFAPQQYNTPLWRAGAGAAAIYFGKGSVREAGKILIGMEAARLTANALNGQMTTSSTTTQTVY